MRCKTKSPSPPKIDTGQAKISFLLGEDESTPVSTVPESTANWSEWRRHAKSRKMTRSTLLGQSTRGAVSTLPEMYVGGVALSTSFGLHPDDEIIRKDLIAASTLSRGVEPVAIIADTDTWEVKLIQIRGGSHEMASPLVAAMLENVAKLHAQQIPDIEILKFIETSLHALYRRSELLSTYLLSAQRIQTMDRLTSCLEMERNDVPLLMAVAHTHTPKLAKMYGVGRN